MPLDAEWERERERERAFNEDERNEEGGEGFFHQASFDLCVLGAYDERWAARKLWK